MQRQRVNASIDDCNMMADPTSEAAVHPVLDWKAAVWAGLLAGLAGDVVMTPLLWWFEGTSPWTPPRMIAAMVFGESVLPPPATFDFSLVATGSAVHFALSVGYALVAGALLKRLEMVPAIAAGAVFGLALYVVNYYLIAPMLFPWFVEARGWITWLTHLVFGSVLGLAYVVLRRRQNRSRT